MSEGVQKLFLDDVRSAPDSTWAVVRSYDAFVAFIEKHGVPEIISFDHDLAEEHYAAIDDPNYRVDGKQFKEKTGYEAAKYIVDRGTFPSLAIIHSLNPVGAMNISQLLRPHCSVVIAPRLMK